MTKLSEYDLICATLVLSVIDLALIIAIIIYEVIHYLQVIH